MKITIDKHEIDLFDRCFKAWGFNSQMSMLAEECLELSLECLHSNRINKKVSIESLAEEIADVELMLKELKYYFKDTLLQSTIDYCSVLKKERLIKLLEEAEK